MLLPLMFAIFGIFVIFALIVVLLIEFDSEEIDPNFPLYDDEF